MKKQLLILTPKDEINKILIDFFKNDFSVIPIYREDILKEEQIIINNDDVLFNGKSIIENTAAAIILDSGYMWPSPAIKISQDEWETSRDKFDELLRNERETNSFWISMLSILNQEIDSCINTQNAFEKETFKPETFHNFQQANITLPPFCIGNNKEINQRFAEEHKGEILSLPLSTIQTEQWLNPDEIDHKPVFLQSLSNRDSRKMICFNGQAISESDIDLIPSEQLIKIHEIVQAPLLELTLRYHQQWCISDFSVSPDLTLLSKDELSYLLNQIKITLA